MHSALQLNVVVATVVTVVVVTVAVVFLLVLIRSVLLIRSTFKAPNQKLPRRPERVRNLQQLTMT